MALGIDLGSFDSKMVELVESNDAIKVKALVPGHYFLKSLLIVLKN